MGLAMQIYSVQNVVKLYNKNYILLYTVLEICVNLVLDEAVTQISYSNAHYTYNLRTEYN